MEVAPSIVAQAAAALGIIYTLSAMASNTWHLPTSSRPLITCCPPSPSAPAMLAFLSIPDPASSLQPQGLCTCHFCSLKNFFPKCHVAGLASLISQVVSTVTSSQRCPRPPPTPVPHHPSPQSVFLACTYPYLRSSCLCVCLPVWRLSPHLEGQLLEGRAVSLRWAALSQHLEQSLARSVCLLLHTE